MSPGTIGGPMRSGLPTQASPAGGGVEPSPGQTATFLDAGVPKERAAWLELWKSGPDREVMAHPDYVRLFLRPGDQAIGAAFGGANAGILHPVIRRPLRCEPWVSGGEEDVCDLTTAYGYGGPFAWNISPLSRELFWRQFEAWARTERVVFAFARLGLFPERQIAFDGDVEVLAPNIVRTLELSEEQLCRDYHHRARQNLNRTRRCNLRFEVDRTGERLDEFLEVYTSTMKRRGALDQYYFPRSFFESIVRDLSGSMMFFHVLSGGRVVSTELVLLSRDHAYSYLGGSLPEAFDLRANVLLKHEAFLWLRDNGWKAVILGGGYRGAPGVLEYKRSLAPRGQVPFRIGTKTYDAVEVERLAEARRRWETGQGRTWVPESKYYPVYRA